MSNTNWSQYVGCTRIVCLYLYIYLVIIITKDEIMNWEGEETWEKLEEEGEVGRIKMPSSYMKLSKTKTIKLKK